MFPHCAFTTIISLCVSNGWYCDLKIVCGFKIKSRMGGKLRYNYITFQSMPWVHYKKDYESEQKNVLK